MNKNINLKRATAGVLSASMLLTSSVISPSTVSAETTVNYGDALALSLYFFDAQQCGDEVDDNCLTWRGDCHTYDGEASLDSANGLGTTEKEFIKNANGGSNTVDVSGGYHDAGDHLKFSMTMAFASTNLAWAYNQYPEAFEETGCKDHLFDILKEMCDYFMKVTYLDDNDEVVAFCYMVGGDQDHNEWSSPETQTMDRPTYWATKSNNSTDAACQMAAALASASMALKEVDASYAEECLKYANALQSFGSTYVNANYDGIGSYYSSGSQNDDIAWGDLWCHLANGEIDSYSPITPQNGVYNGEYDCWIYSWDKVWGGYSTLLSQLGFGSAFSNELKFEMDNQVSNYSQAYYPVGGGWGASRYNCAWQMYAMEYANATSNDQYYEYAKGQMDYLLGNNSQGRSYLLGYTDNYPVHIHHRAANPDKSTATYTLYGALVGGPTDANGSYDDNTDSYSCTEPALDYNGCFIMAIAGLYNKYGDGTENLDTIISNASEIDETYTFGTWYSGSVTPTPTETTTTTEETTTTEDTTTTSETTITTEDTTVTTEDTTITTETTTTTYETTITTEDTTITTEDTTDTTTTAEPLPEIIIGDVTLDGEVKSNDLLLLKKYLLGLEDLTELQFESADTTQDGEVKSNDLLLLKKYLLGLEEL
ncbi:MAG: glycoside hydrolase family 9 protein [Ruminococcus sp.]|nr:glycoside hydrolase family 9 protein [Ruminococcus sp.]